MRKRIVLLVIGVVVWGMGSSQVRGFDIFPVCTATGNQRDADVSGNIVVWEDQRTGNWDIYGYNLSSKSEFVITTNQTAYNSDNTPAIDGDIVVWTDIVKGGAKLRRG